MKKKRRGPLLLYKTQRYFYSPPDYPPLNSYVASNCINIVLIKKNGTTPTACGVV